MKKLSKKDIEELERIRDMKDEDIDYSDIPETDEEFWKDAELVYYPKKKKQLSIRLDPEILEWFKLQGKGYQTKINEVLKNYVDHKIKKSGQKNNK